MEEEPNKNDQYSDPEINLKELAPKLFELVDEFEKLDQFYSWLTTAALAIIGFFITALLQIKFRSPEGLSNKILAAIANTALISSVLTGVYLRLTEEIESFLRKIKVGFIDLFSLPTKEPFKDLKIESRFSEKDWGKFKSIVAEKFDEMIEDLEKPNKVIAVSIQTALFALGVLLVAAYLGLYLFF